MVSFNLAHYGDMLPLRLRRGFSVQRSGHCPCSLTGLPGPQNV
jgi:hypothetical protein